MRAAPSYNFESDHASEEAKPKSPESNYDESKLSAAEVKDVKEGKRTIKDIAAERMQLKAAAEAEMNSLVIAKDERGPIIDLSEYKALREELESTESADKTQDILDKIRDLPKQKEKQQAKEAEDAKELDPENPKLKQLQEKFDQICKENVKYIGTKQVPSFSEWFRQQRQQKPTVKHLSNLVERLEGKSIQDKDGLAPRREEFGRLQAIYKRYGISDPTKSEFIKQEGLSERQEFRKGLEQLEGHLQKMQGTPFYNKAGIEGMMKDFLTADNPRILAEALDQAKKIAQKEATGFTYLDSKITIAGKSIRKMSKKSKEMYLGYYQTTSLKERMDLVGNWQTLVEHESKLAKELEKVYGDRSDELKTALDSFADLDFMEKQKAIKEHKKLVEGAESKEDVQKKLLIKAAHSKIDIAKGQKVLAKATQQKYKEWFSKESNHKDPKTGKFSLVKLQKHYDILTSDTPDGEAKNLSAYEVKRNRFIKEVDALKDINPDISEAELNKWQEQYDNEGWTGRKSVYKKLKSEQEKQEKAMKKMRKLAEAAGLNEEEMETKELEGTLEETINAVTELLQNDQGAEAMKLLLEYNAKDPDNPKILFWIQTVAQYMKEFGSGARKEKTMEKELESELDEITNSDETVKEELEEHQVKSLNLEGAKQSEQKHDHKISAQDRARKESMSRLQSGSLEADLTEDAYEQMGDEHIINEKGTGEKITTVDFGDGGIEEKDREDLKRRTEQAQTRLDDNKGFSHVDLYQDGRQISSKEAESIQEKDAEALTEKLAEKAEERVAAKSGLGETAAVFDLQAKLAAKRKARKLVQDKEQEKLRMAS